MTVHFTKESYTAEHNRELAKYSPYAFGPVHSAHEHEQYLKQKMAKEYPARLGVYEWGDARDLNLVSRDEREYPPHDSGELYKDLKSKMDVGLCLKCEKANDRKDQDECICSSCKAKAFGK